MPKVTIDQKRLESLRRQLYGKSPEDKKQKVRTAHSSITQAETAIYNKEVTPATKSPISANLTRESSNQTAFYLKKDLTKILILSAIALALQTLLYFSLQNHLMNLKFF